MSKLKINLLRLKENLDSRPRRKLFFGFKIALYCSIILVILGLTFSYEIIFSDDSIIINFKKIHLFSQIKYLAEGKNLMVQGELEDRINVLLLGMGGEEHDGPYLTDTIILASFQPSTNKVALLSLPRDMLVPLNLTSWKKINSINAWAESNKPGSGARETAEVLGEILDIEIHYWIRVDFNGFERIIDDLDGVDVYVENTLNDYQYPIRGQENVWPLEARYEHLYIEKGWQHFAGATALKYSRSRHGLRGEGSDFARARRQQQILLAIKEKTLSISTLLNPKKINSLLSALNNHVSTNFEIWEMIHLSKYVTKIEASNIIHKVLEPTTEGLLYETKTEQGAYVLLPRAGDFSEIQSLVANIFNLKNYKINSPPQPEKVRIEIQNGTTHAGLANSYSQKLQQAGYEIIKIGNSSQTGYEKTVIYDLSANRYKNVLQELKSELEANVAVGIPGWLKETFINLDPNLDQANIHGGLSLEAVPEADFLIILGTNAVESQN